MAVFNSWMGKKAVEYRRIERISGLKGTAVNVQAMVFGNMGNNSGTGVAFTRDPNTGEDKFYGDYLINAQGEDVVAGIRTPEPISRARTRDAEGLQAKLARHPPASSRPTTRRCRTSSSRSQEGTLYMLQTRTGKRTGTAAVRIAVEMVKAGLIDENDRDQAGQPRQPESPAAARSSTRRPRRKSVGARASRPARAPPAAR